MPEINGKTRLCGLFGYPVEHSFSPAMHNAAFKHLSINWAYVPFPVRPEDLGSAVLAVRALNMAGVNVTVPHKKAAAALADRLSDSARLTGAVNTIVNDGGALTGHNTDGEGFLRALREDAGIDARTGPALVLGAGGSAGAVAAALALGGAPAVIIANRSGGRAAELCDLISNNTGCRATALGWREIPRRGTGEYAQWSEALGQAVLVVQTTPVGMHPNTGEAPPFPFDLIKPGHVVVDLIYNPGRTLFMERCREAGARAFNGLGMLLHQGAIAFELWTGRTPPLDLMREALKKSIQATEFTEATERIGGKSDLKIQKE